MRLLRRQAAPDAHFTGAPEITLPHATSRPEPMYRARGALLADGHVSHDAHVSDAVGIYITEEP